jgi:hypothetical protein
VRASFLMHRDPIRARLGKCRNELVRILDHQMAIQRQIGHAPQRLYDWRPDSEIRDEMPIHNVHMDDTRATFPRSAHLLTQTGKVCCKNRRCQLDQKDVS